MIGNRREIEGEFNIEIIIALKIKHEKCNREA